MRLHRHACTVWICAVLASMLIGAPFRCCRAEDSGHGPTGSTTLLLPPSSSPFVLSNDSAVLLPASLSSENADLTAAAPRGLEMRHALVERASLHTLVGTRYRYRFAEAASNPEEQQRRRVAVRIGRAVSPRHDAAVTLMRIEAVYRSLQVAHWGRHADGRLGGHFNFDYSAVRCVDLDRAMPHGRYGMFASLHFHHDQTRVHMDVANPYGMAGLLAPAHFFLDVMAGHLPGLRP